MAAKSKSVPSESETPASTPVAVAPAGFAALPLGDFQYLVSVLRDKEPVDFKKGVKALHNVIGYLIDTVWGGDTAPFAIAGTAGRKSRKTIADELETFVVPSAKVGERVAVWLLPILLDLAGKWLANRAK